MVSVNVSYGWGQFCASWLKRFSSQPLGGRDGQVRKLKTEVSFFFFFQILVVTTSKAVKWQDRSSDASGCSVWTDDDSWQKHVVNATECATTSQSNWRSAISRLSSGVKCVSRLHWTAANAPAEHQQAGHRVAAPVNVKLCVCARLLCLGFRL